MINTTRHASINRNYKDSLFRRIFGENEENALSLYNAINDSDYTVEDGFEYTTLEDVVYMKMKNDVSFVVGTSLNVYEHQSTYNPNMPLRGLFYFADIYHTLVRDNEKLYSPQLVQIPNPQYIVFYNGEKEGRQKDVEKLKLSDSFHNKDQSGEFEWTATMININAGYNEELFSKCEVLRHYTRFIELVREYNKITRDLEVSINMAMDRCIEEGVLKDILLRQKKEGNNVFLTEFDQEKYDEIIRHDGEVRHMCKMIAKKRLTLEEALEESGLTEKVFLRRMKEFGFELPTE